MIAAAVSLLLMQAAPRDTAAPAPLAESVAASAYRDPGARELVRRARAYRRAADRSVRAYQALARERSSAGLRTFLRDRLLEGSELAARIDWHRDGPTRVEVLGARSRGIDDDDSDRQPSGIRSEAAELAFDPADDRLRIGLLDTTWIRNPLAEGSERDYRFRSGDTMNVRLSGGESVRVYELRVEPRRLDKPLVSGSIWVEDRSYGVVRTLLRFSHSLTAEIRAESGRDTAGGRHGSVTVATGDTAARRRKGGGGAWALLPDIRLDVRYLTTEYGLVQGRWWMPTLTAVDATVSAGSFAAIPVRFERSYSQYHVEGDPLPEPGATAAAAPASAPAVVQADTPAVCRAAGRPHEHEHDHRGNVPGTERCRCASGVCRAIEVSLPPDSTALASSPDLPAPIDAGTPLLSGKETDELAREVGKVAADPWIFMAPRFRRTPALLRYNRVEALSVGAREAVDLGPITVDGTLRIATATGDPDVVLGVRRESAARRLRLAAYRRLDAANPLERPLGLGNSIGSFFWGRDNGEYFRATGVELLGSPPRSERPWMEWRLFAEHQGPVSTRTDVTLRSAFESFGFRPNITADRAGQAGVALTLRPVIDRALLGGRWAAELGVEGEAGTYRFARPSLSVRGAFPLGGLAAAVEGAAGTSFGDVPVQSLWYLGGPGTLRGYDGGTAAGTAFWRGRGEVGTGSGAARLSLFSDVGWAGARDSFTLQAPLWSAGVGASVLDGLFRADLARAVRRPAGWRLELYMDGAL